MEKYYAIVTRTGATIVPTWELAQAFMKIHPGAEFHKKFLAPHAAFEFIRDKAVEMGMVARGEPIKLTRFPRPEGSSIDRYVMVGVPLVWDASDTHIQQEQVKQFTACSSDLEDDEPPW